MLKLQTEILFKKKSTSHQQYYLIIKTEDLLRLKTIDITQLCPSFFKITICKKEKNLYICNAFEKYYFTGQF